MQADRLKQPQQRDTCYVIFIFMGDICFQNFPVHPVVSEFRFLQYQQMDVGYRHGRIFRFPAQVDAEKEELSVSMSRKVYASLSFHFLECGVYIQ